ncbi:MAG: FAD-binding oxidoreductase, partial [Zetaproteobacteria bacterium]|nr:FAD-binding oxidoreductase [Zetaproteobacteria bacterium]
MHYSSWGRTCEAIQSASPVYWRHEVESQILNQEQLSLLPYGCGRSYGDVCLNHQGRLLLTQPLHRFIRFDAATGILECESGVTLAMILDLVVSQGWFLPVTPGTQYVTVGGAVANDVHGKNHHQAGTFGCHVLELQLLRSDGKLLRCSPQENAQVYRATIGGLGLTGLIVTVKFQLLPIHSPYMDVEIFKFSSLDEYLNVYADYDQKYPYTVAWVDAITPGKYLGRGHLICGKHTFADKMKYVRRKSSFQLTIPFDLPSFILNRRTVGLFNQLYYHRFRLKVTQSVAHYRPFFYPLDCLRHWNRMYGRQGFFQFQCTVPPYASSQLKVILNLLCDSGIGSFLAVLKTFGTLKS